MPWPRVFVAFVLFNEGELISVEDPVNKVRSKVDDVVENYIDSKIKYIVADFVLVLLLHQTWPVFFGKVGNSHEEGKGDKQSHN